MIIILSSIKVFSTPQVKDYLIIGEDTFYLYESPLEQIANLSEKIDKIINLTVESSACWRGFKAEWKIIDSILYLSKVFPCVENGITNSVIEKVVGQKFKQGLLKASWVNDTIWCGNQLSDMYIDDVYKHEYELNIKHGCVINKTEHNYIPCEYSDIDGIKLNEFVMERLNWDTIPELSDNEIKIGASLYVDENGSIKDVVMLRPRSYYLNNAVLRILKQLPCWKVYFSQGELLNKSNDIIITIKKEDIKKYVR